jgi:hypothetical protein
MKTLSRFFAPVVIAVITTIVVVGCCLYLPVLPGIATYSVEIGGASGCSPDPAAHKASIYVDVKDKGKLDAALAHIRSQSQKGGSYCLCYKAKDGDTPHWYDDYVQCPRYYKCPSTRLRTVSITKSKAADNIAAGGSAVNDPNITYRVQSPDPKDVSDVLAALATTSAP